MCRLLFLILLGYAIISCKQQSTTDEPEQKQNNLLVDTTQIDVVKVSPNQCKVLLENEQVRIFEYSLKPGEKDTPHTHPPKTYYVVSGGTLRVYPENQRPFDAEEVQGQVEWSGYVGKHYVENIGSTTVTLVVTEVKVAAKK